jgi:hypothetical protein
MLAAGWEARAEGAAVGYNEVIDTFLPGSVIGLQEMLMQTGDERLLLLPAWPEDWEVDFKLHAPDKTVVEAKVKDGRVERLHKWLIN